MNNQQPNSMPFFSIIIPVYNAEAFLRKCIDSILSQTFLNFEIILVDDGSSDNCPWICDRYAQKDSRIHVIHQKNGGSSSARNAGIRIASGEYIMFVDSDDYWNSATALCAIAESIKQLRCDVLCMNFYKVYAEATSSMKYFADSETYIGIEQVLRYERYVSSAWSKVIKSTLLLDGHMDFVENVYSEDIDWSMRLLLKTNNIAYLDLAFYCYLQRPESISRSMNTKKMQDLKDNVYTCIQLLREQDKRQQEILSPYAAYQYAVLLLNIASISDKRYQTKLLSGLEKECGLLRHSSSSKVRAINMAYKTLGFRGMLWFLSVYARFKM